MRCCVQYNYSLPLSLALRTLELPISCMRPNFLVWFIQNERKFDFGMWIWTDVVPTEWSGELAACPVIWISSSALEQRFSQFLCLDRSLIISLMRCFEMHNCSVSLSQALCTSELPFSCISRESFVLYSETDDFRLALYCRDCLLTVSVLSCSFWLNGQLSASSLYASSRCNWFMYSTVEFGPEWA